MDVQQLDRNGILAHVLLFEDARPQVNVWLERGDGIAVYQNADLSHPMVGEIKLVSFGSDAAMLETNDPPMRLPDIGNEINWRYQLIATYKGEAL
jgi:hypothetical protein